MQGDNKSEVLLQIFDPTEKIYSDLTGQFPVQSGRGNNYILVAYHYNAKKYSHRTTQEQNRALHPK